MAEEHEKCPDCDTPLVDLERRLEVTDADASHRHHAVDCVRVLKERVKTLEGDLHGAIVCEREAEAKAASADVIVLPVSDGIDGEIDVFTDGHSHHYIPSSTLNGYVPIELAQLKDTLIAKLISEKTALEETLRFYADGGTHVPPGHSAQGWCRDSGHRARLALGLPSEDK